MFFNKLFNKLSELLSRPRARELADKAFSKCCDYGERETDYLDEKKTSTTYLLNLGDGIEIKVERRKLGLHYYGGETVNDEVIIFYKGNQVLVAGRYVVYRGMILSAAADCRAIFTDNRWRIAIYVPGDGWEATVLKNWS